MHIETRNPDIILISRKISLYFTFHSLYKRIIFDEIDSANIRKELRADSNNLTSKLKNGESVKLNYSLDNEKNN